MKHGHYLNIGLNGIGGDEQIIQFTDDIGHHLNPGTEWEEFIRGQNEEK